MKVLVIALFSFGGAICVLAAPPEPTVVHTNDVPWDVGPEQGITLKRFAGNLARLNIVKWESGTFAAPHTHATEQIILVQTGRYRITLETQEHVLEAGDLMVFASYAIHGIEALEDSSHIAVFAPAALPD